MTDGIGVLLCTVWGCLDNLLQDPYYFFSNKNSPETLPGLFFNILLVLNQLQYTPWPTMWPTYRTSKDIMMPNRGIYFSESVCFFPTFFTTSLNFFPISCTQFHCSFPNFFPKSNFGWIISLPIKQGICKNNTPDAQRHYTMHALHNTAVLSKNAVCEFLKHNRYFL